MTKFLLSVTAIAAMIFSLAVPAEAIVVRNGGSLIFFDDYEGPNGVNPSQPSVNNGSFPGSWTNDIGTLLVRESNWNVETPVAFDGNQMAGNFGTNTDDGHFATFDQTQTSGTIQVEMYIWTPSGLSNDRNSLNLELENGSHANRAYAVTIHKTGGNYLIFDDFGGGNLTNLTVIPDQWQKLEIDYVLGSTDLTVKLDGASQTINGIGSGGISQATHLGVRVTGGNGGNGYIDAIPEPGTLSLLALGGLMILRRRRSA